MPTTNDIAIQDELRNLSAKNPAEWGLEVVDLNRFTEYLCSRRYDNTLETKHVLQAGMLLCYFGPNLEPEFLEWLRGDKQCKTTIESLAALREIMLESKCNKNDFATIKSKIYNFYMDKEQLHDKNMKFAKKAELVTRLQKFLSRNPQYNNDDATFIIKFMYRHGIETFNSMPENLYEFLAWYLNNLALRDKIIPAQVLFAGILLRMRDVKWENISATTRNNLISIVLQENMSLQRILFDKNAHNSHPELAKTLMANIEYMLNKVCFNENSYSVKDIYKSQLQSFLSNLSHNSGSALEITTYQEILNFLQNCKLCNDLAPGYKNLWLSLIVHVAYVMGAYGKYSNEFIAWVDNYIKIKGNSEYSYHLLEEINKVFPKFFKDRLFELIRVNIKEHLQVYPETVIAFLNGNKLLNKPGFDMDLYFTEQVLSEHDIQRNIVERHRVECDKDSNAILDFAIKVISKAKATRSVLRFNLSPIIQYSTQKDPGYNKLCGIYFSIKAIDLHTSTMYSPNLYTGPEVVKNSDFKKFEQFILKICNSRASTAKIKLIRILPEQYELVLKSCPRSITPLLAYVNCKPEKEKNNSVQIVRSKSENSLKTEKHVFSAY